LVEQEQQEENQSAILIPEIVARMSDFSLVKLLAVAPDCEKFNGEVGQVLVANTNMIESIKVGNKSFSIILENHIVGLISS
jgi:hypothetical protein